MKRMFKALTLFGVIAMLGLAAFGCGQGAQDAEDGGEGGGESGVIIGIEPGSGVVQATEDAIDEYGLDFELRTSSSAGMAAALQKAIQNEEWIAVTGWTPHWKFAQWDLKYLEDPENVFGDAEHIATIVRTGLEDEMPGVYQVLDQFQWTPEQMGEVMLNIQEDVAPEEAAADFVENNQDLVDEWTEGVDSGSGQVELGFVEWDSEIASTNVVKTVLEDLGYDVTITAVDAGVMWSGIQNGDFDGIVAAWLPATHEDYYANVEEDVENLGPNLEGAKIGLVVPEYVEIDSIEEMNEVKGQFRGSYE